jgi:hypothetical protein
VPSLNRRRIEGDAVKKTITVLATAWVLWWQSEATDYKWQVFDGYPTYELCSEAQDRGFDRAKKTKIIMVFICLPDTVDPREKDQQK